MREDTQVRILPTQQRGFLREVGLLLASKSKGCNGSVRKPLSIFREEDDGRAPC